MYDATTRLDIEPGSAIAFLGNLYEVRGEDGIYTTANWQIGVTIGSKDFVHPQTFVYRDQENAEAFVARINTRGAITPSRWVELEPTPSLEERLSPGGTDWEAEQEDRRGWGIFA